MWAHICEPPPQPARRGRSCREALDTVVARAMAKEPAERYASPAELAAAARAALPSPQPTTRGEACWRSPLCWSP